MSLALDQGASSQGRFLSRAQTGPQSFHYSCSVLLPSSFFVDEARRFLMAKAQLFESPSGTPAKVCATSTN
jgi:hypothetical protein